ncbi:putative MscS family protein.1 precursor [Rhodobacteraceae bacterium THAF1]|uniref:mechanosensitive ion channel family protein n=1 Tax=Palleronia sp. THAF1 TaxID=2587842 RepID=UPI000F3DFA20|nr:mechanosensitive ion channel domain-containing protein [Palleronia sp. THAF1]QFU07137.1 putative MscS family protein.1 precursor [Palleronia sp. THAF1]VDC16710.1 putative MscS family protein.1 precursor [Rhodobacteraceae bacterium THAF1]
METEFASLTAELQDIWRLIQIQGQNLLLPSRLWQLGIIVAVFLAAHLLRLWAQPRMRAWMKGRDWPMWRLRALLVVNRRLRIIFFSLLMWVAYYVMTAITPFPSRSFLLELVATLATGWLMVIFGSRLVRNPALRTLVRWALWAYVTLWVLGLTQEVSDALDQIGFALGETRLTVLTLLQAVVLVTLFFVAAKFFAAAGSDRIQKSEDLSPSLKVLLVKILQIALFGAALFVGLKTVGVDLTGLAFLSGAIGVGLGFGLQKVVSNLVSGVIILLDKSIKPGDVISLGETFGWVGTLGARYASVTTRDGREYLIPNEDLITGQVVNWSHSNDFVRLDVHFGTAYGDDPHKVRAVAIEATSNVSRVQTSRPPVCHIVGFGDSSVDYILRFWITDPTGGLTNIRGNVYLALWDAFQENGISIPFPQREVTVLNDQLTVRRDD